MRIVVYPHDLGIGGSQLNAIELAAAVRDLGHEVIVFGPPGALEQRIAELGLEFVPAPKPGKRPSPTVARALAELIDDRGIELVHGYEWPPALEAALAARMRPGVVSMSTVMSMSVPGFIPRTQPLVVGTEQIADAEHRRGRRGTMVIEPPVDLSINNPTVAVGTDDFRLAHGLDPSRATIVSVTRFAHELKLEGTLAAIDVVSEIARDSAHPPQLVLVGDGPARDEVEERIRLAEQRTGMSVVTLTGQISDPRPAYAAADIALGMGGSALRALAFGKPLVVQGEGGYWKLLTPESLDEFLWQGWYGVGADAATGADDLDAILRPLLSDPARQVELGAFGLETVTGRFSLTAAGGRQEQFYRDALQQRPSVARVAVADFAALARYSTYYLGKRMRRALGREQADDFNARPVAGRAVASR
ncbi:glycosyltransferase family 4 protein [Lacisediminihabitans changchengi]|uniref:D-inositol 3-phosphate glycosyltransferase n=1 Tax=Lacisediminihabitans changchengi TaxID=2787634 RepID=A0A934W4Q3_9MICO|nr:glycosyltransferase family 4 protein [Lacisediminihabitans changchengi]MBK4348514.1 glycosyltransferase family 4 protein [Lacisediminihabitans changchengi]